VQRRVGRLLGIERERRGHHLGRHADLGHVAVGSAAEGGRTQDRQVLLTGEVDEAPPRGDLAGQLLRARARRRGGRIAAREVLRDLALRLLEGHHARGLALLDPHQVEALRRLDHVAERAGSLREGGLLERLHHGASREPAEVAALRLRGLVLARLRRHLGEVGARRDALAERVDALPRVRLRSLVARIEAHEEVARPRPLGTVELGLPALVAPADALGIGAEQRLRRVVGKLEVFGQRPPVEPHGRDRHLLERVAHGIACFGVRERRALAEQARGLVGEQVRAEPLLEAPHAAELALGVVRDGLAVEPAVVTDQAGSAQVLPHLGIAHREPHLLALPGEEPRAEQGAPGAVDQQVARPLFIELVAERLAVALLHAEPHALEIAPLERDVAHLHHGAAARGGREAPLEAQVEDEHGADADDHDPQHDPGALTEDPKHAASPGVSPTDRPRVPALTVPATSRIRVAPFPGG